MFLDRALEDTRVIILWGETINETIFTSGSFVMNFKNDILDVYQDFQTGKMGILEEKFSQ